MQTMLSQNTPKVSLIEFINLIYSDKKKVYTFSPPKNSLIADGHKNDLMWDITAFGEIILNK